MKVYVITETLYNMSNNLFDDFGHAVNCLTKLVGVFADEKEALDVQERLYAESQHPPIPLKSEDIKVNETYIDIVMEETSMKGERNDK